MRGSGHSFPTISVPFRLWVLLGTCSVTGHLSDTLFQFSRPSPQSPSRALKECDLTAQNKVTPAACNAEKA